MSQNVIQNPEDQPEQPNDSKDLESRLDGLRQQIADLQRDLIYLEEYLQALKRRQGAPQASAEPLSPPCL